MQKTRRQRVYIVPQRLPRLIRGVSNFPDPTPPRTYDLSPVAPSLASTRPAFGPSLTTRFIASAGTPTDSSPRHLRLSITLGHPAVYPLHFFPHTLCVFSWHIPSHCLKRIATSRASLYLTNMLRVINAECFLFKKKKERLPCQKKKEKAMQGTTRVRTWVSGNPTTSQNPL